MSAVKIILSELVNNALNFDSLNIYIYIYIHTHTRCYNETSHILFGLLLGVWNSNKELFGLAVLGSVWDSTSHISSDCSDTKTLVLL